MTVVPALRLADADVDVAMSGHVLCEERLMINFVLSYGPRRQQQRAVLLLANSNREDTTDGSLYELCAPGRSCFCLYLQCLRSGAVLHGTGPKTQPPLILSFLGRRTTLIAQIRGHNEACLRIVREKDPTCNMIALNGVSILGSV